jgi:hypothetical protein
MGSPRNRPGTVDKALWNKTLFFVVLKNVDDVSILKSDPTTCELG